MSKQFLLIIGVLLVIFVMICSSHSPEGYSSSSQQQRDDLNRGMMAPAGSDDPFRDVRRNGGPGTIHGLEGYNLNDLTMRYLMSGGDNGKRPYNPTSAGGLRGTSPCKCNYFCNCNNDSPSYGPDHNRYDTGAYGGPRY